MAKRFNPPPGGRPPRLAGPPRPGGIHRRTFRLHRPTRQLWTDDALPVPPSRGRRPSWRSTLLRRLLCSPPSSGSWPALVAHLSWVAPPRCLRDGSVLSGPAGSVRPTGLRPGRAGAGLALLVAGAVFSAPVPVAVPPPTATSPAPSPSVSTPPTTPSAAPTSPVTPRPRRSPEPRTALATLAGLTVKGRAPRTGYDRTSSAAAGVPSQVAVTPDRPCVPRPRQRPDPATDDCTVTGGKLNDPYTGAAVTAKTTSVDDLEADHIVAASDAWQKGAQTLSEDRREAFYNDLLNLQTTIGAVNASKGDGDAATWLPPNRQYRCTYVARQIAVKAKYELWVTKPEKAAMTRVLTRCPGQPLPTAATARKVVDKKPTMVNPQPTPAPRTSPKATPLDHGSPPARPRPLPGTGPTCRAGTPSTTGTATTITTVWSANAETGHAHPRRR